MPTVTQVEKDFRPYRFVRHEAHRVVKGRKYHIFSFGAYDTRGLIGPEYSGVVVADTEEKEVVLVDYLGGSYGWYPGYENESRVSQCAAHVSRLANCSAAKFLRVLREKGAGV